MNRYGLTPSSVVTVRDGNTDLTVEPEYLDNVSTTVVISTDTNDGEDTAFIHLTDEQRVFVIKALGGRV